MQTTPVLNYFLRSYIYVAVVPLRNPPTLTEFVYMPLVAPVMDPTTCHRVEHL